MIVNLTPHDINIIANGKTITLKRDGSIARIEEGAASEMNVLWDGTNPIPVYGVEYGKILGLPAPNPGTFYVVSSMIAEAAKALGRKDVLSPYGLVRDEKGVVVGAKGLKY
jgi:hypothetical protein